MKCQGCQAEIPPAWVNAINKNECPGCGGAIMDEQQKTLLVELREAMSKMPNDPEGLAGWLLSNYTLTKVGTAEPTAFHRKQSDKKIVVHRSEAVAEDQNGNAPSSDSEQKLIPEERMNIFQKRAGTSRLKDLANKIKGGGMSSGAADPSEFPEDAEESDDFVELDHNPLNKRELNQMSDIFGQSNAVQELELQKLKQMRLQNEISGGSVGKIKRSY